MIKLLRKMQVNRLLTAIPMILFLSFSVVANAQTPDNVTTYSDENGWKLKVNGEDFFVKGMVWGYCPVGENYSYNLWGQSDEFIKKVLHQEFTLLQEAGVNTIRLFGIVPPRWITYIYEKYGVMTIVNHLMGRYGYNVGGVWIPNTNYQDELTRETLINDFVAMVEEFKDVKGVVMFALGNENNYGLHWSSFEIENLPKGEQHKGKAKYLYTMYNEAIAAAKKVNTNHPYSIVNGDIQYLDLIVEHCKEVDILGVNCYRGKSFTDLWERVDKEANIPVMFTEFGSDAFNAMTLQEEHLGQAEIVKANWEEIYNKAYGNGEEGNAIGGCQFQWRDEWWKYKQTENLDIHDKTASWSNGAGHFDYAQGFNNMNEEWFGVCAMGEPNEDGIYATHPRMAYDILKEMWTVDPYTTDKKIFNSKFAKIDMNSLHSLALMRSAKVEKQKSDKFKMVGGSIEGDLLFSGLSDNIEKNGKSGLDFSHGEMLFLDFEFQPTTKIKGDFTLNILGNVPNKPMEEYYGKRGETYVSVITTENEDGLMVSTDKEINDAERVEIYDFELIYNLSDNFDLKSFYHKPRYHWGYFGDFYGLMYEVTDMDGMDIWGEKAPYGIELAGKGTWDGFNLVAGPEVYWGANPKVIGKLPFHFGAFNFMLMHAEDFARAEGSAAATVATRRETRQSALYMITEAIPKTKLELGCIMAGSEKIGEDFKYYEDENIYHDEIKLEDTFGAKAKLTFNTLIGNLDISAKYSGLVADGGNPLQEFDSTIPSTESGNKYELEAGMLIPKGNWWFLPRGLYRKNLIDANPIIEATSDGTTLNPGLMPRNTDADPFAVLGNREAISGEFFITYDDTPASFFYAWDADKKEDAGLAFSIGGNFTRYPTETDAYLFYYQEGKTNASFGMGLPAEDVWMAKARIIMNPNPRFKFISNISGGKQQSSGDPSKDSAEFITMDAKFIFNKAYHLSMFAKKDAWGPLDWYRQFNITFPYQFGLDYSILIDNAKEYFYSSRIGVKTLFRTLNEDSPSNIDGLSDYEFQSGIYYSVNF